MTDLTDSNTTFKYSYEEYTRFSDQSAQVQHIIASCVSSLSTSFQLIPNPSNFTSTFSIKEIDQAKERVFSVLLNLKQKISSQLQLLFEVNHNVQKLNLNLRRVVDLMKYETQKSNFTIYQLQRQLDLKQKEIMDCQNDNQTEKHKKMQEDWKTLHYIGLKITPPDFSHHSYVKILEEFRDKLGQQIFFEKQQMSIMSRNIGAKLNDIRQKMIKFWSKIGLIDKKTSVFIGTETKQEHKYNERQRQYLRTQKNIDGFEFHKLNEIRQKLRKLEQDGFIDSPQFFTYSDSNGEQHQLLEESSVIGAIRF